ncbi:Alpha-keto-acid decarboxylase [Beauveria bassiana D1-5]|uniref:Alpha-keto-acid decarboxylase n=1 Tax=Beauveria bassiana D1-5 TaxID=1245745 RepID=A0A0A2VB30_BEABA|nr:Alpha-keto-acid decarboxylase [Beauveria bassiana D1-5]
MKLTYLPLYTIACAFTTNAATVEFYSDADCGNKVGDRDVWDNSCAAENPEFKSVKVTATGGWGQRLWTYSDELQDACWVSARDSDSSEYARLAGVGAFVTTFGLGELSAYYYIGGQYAEYVPVVLIVREALLRFLSEKGTNVGRPLFGHPPILASNRQPLRFQPSLLEP